MIEPGDCVTADITLTVHGVPLRVQLTVPAKPVKPQLMLPVFQQLSNACVNFAADLIEKAGQTVSCQKGCAACCRQAVALSEIEVYHIAALVSNLPEPRRTEIKLRFEKAVAHFRKIGWFEQLDSCQDEAATKQAALAYYTQHVDCPFLEDELCLIHEARPIACREYAVTSPKEHCTDLINAPLRMLPLLVNAADGVRRVARSGNLGKKSVVPLVLALEWAEQYPENFSEKTGEEWLADFFGSGFSNSAPAHPGLNSGESTQKNQVA